MITSKDILFEESRAKQLWNLAKSLSDEIDGIKNVMFNITAGAGAVGGYLKLKKEKEKLEKERDKTLKQAKRLRKLEKIKAKMKNKNSKK